MKQPKFFIKSKSGSFDRSPSEPSHHVAQEVPDPAVVVAEKAPRSRINISPKILFGVGMSTLVLLFSLGIVPSYLRSHPIPIALKAPEHGPAILEQKGGVGIQNGLQFDAKIEDARVEILAGFLSRYNSPLKPAEKYAQILVEIADKYDLDYRLLPAIMMQESNLCKTSDPAIHNCLGFGIHKRGTLAFDSYEEGFDRAAREIKTRYIDIGLTTPEEIMKKYTPSSNGSWANSVNQWIAEMEYNSRSKGIESEEDMDLTLYSSKTQ